MMYSGELLGNMSWRGGLTRLDNGNIGKARASYWPRVTHVPWCLHHLAFFPFDNVSPLSKWRGNDCELLAQSD